MSPPSHGLGTEDTIGVRASAQRPPLAARRPAAAPDAGAAAWPERGTSIVVGVFVLLAVAAGLGFYGLTVYLRALAVERGFSISSVSGATAVFFLVSGLAGLPVARLLERHDVRTVVSAGAVIGGTALILLGRATTLWQVYVVYALFGVGFAASALLPGTTVITRWFPHRRTVAMSIATTGLSVGGIILTPLAARLLATLGIAGASPWLAAAYVGGIVPAALILLRPPPGAPVVAPVVGRDTGAVRKATHSRLFRLLTAVYVVVMLAQVGALAHHFNLVAERTDAAFAASAVALLATAAVIGRVFGTWLALRTPLRRFAAILILVQAAGILGLGIAPGRATLLAATLLVGLTMGNLLMLHPLLLVDAFGAADYSRIFSRSQLWVTFGVAAGPAFVGFLHDRAGGYVLPLAIVAILTLPASLALLRPGRAARTAPHNAAG